MTDFSCSSELVWVPLPDQEETFKSSNPAPVSKDILLNKLAVGDEIEGRCIAVKGVGRDHAKFSPVSAAYYKFLPIIKLLQPIEGDQALKLQKSFAPGVIGVSLLRLQIDNHREVIIEGIFMFSINNIVAPDLKCSV